MSERWSSLNIEAPFPDIMPQLIEPIQDVVGAARVAVNAALPLLELIAALQGMQADPLALSLEAFLRVFEGLLEDMSGIAAGHLLSVPVLKTLSDSGRAPLIPVDTLDKLGIVGTILQPHEDLFGGGGNYGLYRVIVESMFDPDDYARPQFSDDAYVAGAIFVYGSDNALEAMLMALRLNAILGASIPWPSHNHAIPVPQDVRVRVIGTADFAREKLTPVLNFVGRPIGATVGAPTAPPFGAHVRWQRPSRISTHHGWGFKYEPTHWHVFIKEGSPIEEGEDVKQYEVDKRQFKWNALDDGRHALLSGLDPAGTYYVSVGYTVVGTYHVAGLGVGTPGRDETTTFEPYALSMLSDQLRVRWDESSGGSGTRFSGGTPPDWIAINHPLNAFPQFQQFLKEYLAKIGHLREVFSGHRSELLDMARMLGQKINQADAFIAKLEEDIKKLELTFRTLSAGLWWSPFSGQGGVPFIVKTMGDLLLKAPDRPPFDHGNEAVGALVFVAGSETVGGLQNFMAGFDAMQSPKDERFTVGPEDLGTDDVAADAPGEGTAPRRSSLRDLELDDEDPC